MDVWEVRQEDRELVSLRKEKEKKQGGGNEGREKVGGRGIGETMYLKEKEGIKRYPGPGSTRTQSLSLAM